MYQSCTGKHEGDYGAIVRNSAYIARTKCPLLLKRLEPRNDCLLKRVSSLT